jgi:2-octaprenyl-6-methoxyphenol hydroxylase
VVGAGAAGLAAALAFARDGFETCLVGTPEARPDGRTVALLDGSVRFLKALGVWPALEGEAAPLATMRIVDDTAASSARRRPPSRHARSGSRPSAGTSRTRGSSPGWPRPRALRPA